MLSSSNSSLASLDRSRTLFAALGMFFCYAWTYLSFNASSGTFWNLGYVGGLFYVHQVSGLTSGLVFALLAIRRLRHQVELTPRLVLISGVILLAGTLCYTFSEIPTVVQLIGAFACGISSPTLILGIALAYRGTSMRDIIISTSLAILAANSVNFASLLMPSGMARVLPILMALLATVSVAKSLEKAATDNRLPRSTDLKWADAPLRFGAGMLAVSFAFGIGRVSVGRLNVGAGTGGWLALWGTAAVCAALLVWGVFSRHNMVGLGNVYKAILPVLATAVTFIPLFGTSCPNEAIALFKACNAADSAVMWLIIVNISRSTRASTVLATTTIFAAHHLGVFLGQQAAWALGDFETQLSIVSVFLIVAAASYMFEGTDASLVFDSPTPEEVGGDADTLDDRISSVAAAHGLTPRESELFSYWATGHNSRYIQDKMGVSAETVKTHIRHIYEKCGVHSREEVIALLGEDRR